MMRATINEAAMIVVRLTIWNDRSGFMSGTIIIRCAAASPTTSPMSAGFQKY